MSVDLTSWLQALRTWQNSGHMEDGTTVVWSLVFILIVGLASLYAFLSLVSLTIVVPNVRVIVSVGVICLVMYAFIPYLPQTFHTWQNPPAGFQTQLEQTFDISVKRSEATLENKPNSAEFGLFHFDRLNASLEQMRDANMPDDGIYDLEYTSKDGTLHHGTLCVDGHSVTVYDQDGKPLKVPDTRNP